MAMLRGMTGSRPPPSPPAKKPPPKRAARLEREAAALRANLRKRNEQRRARPKNEAK